MRKSMVVLLLLCAAGAAAEEPKLRTFAGGFSTRWKTRGHHGHDQHDRCLEPRPQPGTCDHRDFNRGNLDNSIGYRMGLERDFVRAGMLHLLGGADTSLSYSEFNISQKDLMFVNGTVSAGADLAHRGFRLGGRYGVGAYVASTYDYGVQWFHEVVATAPLRSGASLRVSRRYMHKTRGIDRYASNFYPLEGPIQVTETAVMFVASPDVKETKWEYSASSGSSAPGGLYGNHRFLKQAGWHRLTAARELPWKNLEARASWTAFAHESWMRTEFNGFPGNERSKTVDAFGVGLWNKHRLGSMFSLHYGLGLEAADWRDEHHLLLADPQTDIIGGVETGGVLATALRMRLGRGTAIEANVENAYWTGIGLSETRWGLGLVLTR